MEIVKNLSNFINPHWLVVVGTGLYTHLRQICVIGLCYGEDNNPPFDLSYASALFTFSVLCLLAEYRLWPRTLKDPPIHLLYIYEMLVATLTTDLAMRIIWTPLMKGTVCLTGESSRLLEELNTALGLGSKSYLISIANYMSASDAAAHVALCMSLLSFVWMLDATEALDAIPDAWANNSGRGMLGRQCKCSRRISFSDPEVTGCFFYKFICPGHFCRTTQQECT